jgi:hypothetical protein
VTTTAVPEFMYTGATKVQWLFPQEKATLYVIDKGKLTLELLRMEDHG